MSAHCHTWKLGRGGRKFTSAPGGVTAELHCATCPNVGSRKIKSHLPPEMIDRAFMQTGWVLDPPACPECIQREKEERQMTIAAATTAPSEAAVLATGRVFKLLTAHFDDTAGRFSAGWSDKKIASETGVALTAVTTLRVQCFGDLKEDPAVAEMRFEIAALDALCTETFATIQQQVAEMRAKLGKIGAAS